MIPNSSDEQARLPVERVESSSKASIPVIVAADQPLSEFGWSRRASNIFSNVGVKTVGQLAGYSDEDLLKIRNLGRTTLREIRRFLKKHQVGDAPSKPAKKRTPEKFDDLNDRQKIFLSRDLASLDLPVRLLKAFRRLDLDWAGDVVLLSREDLMSISNLGQTSVAALEALAAR